MNPANNSQKPFRNWLIGDLIMNIYTNEIALVLGVQRISLDIITVSGSAFAIGLVAANNEWIFIKHSDLYYESDTIRKAEQDFVKGLFTTNFNELV